MNEWMNERTNEWTNEWLDERTNEWTNEWMNERTNERMNELVNEGTSIGDEPNEVSITITVQKIGSWLMYWSMKNMSQV